VIYVLGVGGDFMHGRFWTGAFAVAAPVLAELASRSRSLMAALAAACIAVVALETHSPIKTSDGYVETSLDRYPIVDERGHYFPSSSLWAWLRWDPRRDGEVFPRQHWSFEGVAARDNPTLRCVSANNVGYFGYWVGIRKTIIDKLALGDALLARLPCKRPWRIGHFERNIPEGYVESVLSGGNRIADPDLARFYGKLRLITQGSLWSFERLETILAMNLGCYNHLLRSYTRAQ